MGAAIVAIVVATAVWVAYDSAANRISVDGKPYSFGNGALAWFFRVAALWIVMFPYYLVKRSRFMDSQLHPPPGRGRVPSEDAAGDSLLDDDEGTDGRALNKPDDSLGPVILVIPFVGMLFAGFWVGGMSVIHDQAAPLGLVAVGTVLLTAALIAAEASRLGVGGPGDKNGKWGPAAWFFFVAVLWVVGYPAYLYRRRKYGVRNYVVIGTLLMAMFVYAVFEVITLIEERQRFLESGSGLWKSLSP